MPQYELDSQGIVNGSEFSDLSPFIQGYIECLFFTNEASGESMTEWWSEETQEALREGRTDGCLPGDAGYSDLSIDALRTIHKDCNLFITRAWDLLTEAYERDYDATQAGRDFWFTRNGHGVGFWDRKELESEGLHEKHGSPRVGDANWNAYIEERDADSLGDKLSDIARGFGTSDVYFYEGEDSPTGYGWVEVT